MKITKRQLRGIIQEVLASAAGGGDQLPYRSGQQWMDKDALVDKGTSTDADIDYLDRELTQQEMDDAGYYDEQNYPLQIGYTDKDGNKVQHLVHNDGETDDFFHTFFRDYGMKHPYSVDKPEDLP